MTWITKHPVVSLKKIFDFDNDEEIDGFVEDAITLRYMLKYGVDKVRGGIFCELVLNQEDRQYINNFLEKTDSGCYLCRSKKHYFKQCPSIICNECKEQGHISRKCPNTICHKCGRVGHWEIDCEC